MGEEQKRNDSQYLKTKAVSGFAWKFMERGGVQLIQVVILILLARLLTPEDYGMVGIVSVFIAIANIFVMFGMSDALIQKKTVDDLDYSTAFYINLMIAFTLYLCLFFCAPLIAQFYREATLTHLVRIQSLTLFFGPFLSVQFAVLSRELAFKKSFYRNVGAIAISGIIGILLAFLGFGVWALVIYNLSNNAVGVIILWVSVDWRPKALFSGKRAGELFSFGGKVLFAKVIDGIYKDVYTLIIGKLFSYGMVGYYNRGSQMPKILVSSVSTSITGVMFPILSASQEDRGQLLRIMKRSVRISCFLVFPIVLGFAAVAKPFTLFLLTEKWLPSVSFTQVACLMVIFWPLQEINQQVIKALGRSDLLLRLEIIKKVLGVAVILVTIPHGIMAMVWGQALCSCFNTIIDVWPNQNLLGYGLWDQLGDILPPLLLAAVMALSVSFLTLFHWSTEMLLTLQVLGGILIYTGGAWLLGFESFRYLLDSILEFLQARKSREKTT